MTTRTYRQTRRADATERTRAAILLAARELFREDPGFDPSLEALAERAGVSTRTVIRQFGSKEGVLEEAITAGVED
ncbi:MAG TPA: helix-turn-helix domain-containing protein, partial [Solirubrobacterales bacterium]|nr:helix-turn-helix domain-containing protein [Solirubrobacterales bacterium]